MSLYLQTALDAVHAAQDIILQYYHGDFAVELKPDQSPVTIADVQTEQTIKNIM